MSVAGIRQREDGKFECLADDCDYAGNTRDAIYKHVSRHHGRSVQLVKGTGPPDPQKEKNKSCVRAKRVRDNSEIDLFAAAAHKA